MKSQWITSPLTPLILLSLCAGAISEVLEPPKFDQSSDNAKGWRISATSTCGVFVDRYGREKPALEEYCDIVGAYADSPTRLLHGQSCHVCNPSDPNKNHSAIHALDGSERWWQSPPLSRGPEYERVNLTIDLGQELYINFIVVVTANSPRPAIWVLERSRDFGRTYKPWQYFAESPTQCTELFQTPYLKSIPRDDTVLCDIEQTKLIETQKKNTHFKGDEIFFSLLKNRPSGNNIYKSALLQDWAKATNIRFRFLGPNTLKGQHMTLHDEDSSFYQRLFYSIRGISISSHCVCNGHAKECNHKNRSLILECECKHNTCGAQCERCCKGYEQKQWKPSIPGRPFVCEPCNCHGHSDDCEFNPGVEKSRQSLDVFGNYNGGGVCKDCKHNTEGINCERCKPGFYRPSGTPLNATNVCIRCNCNERHVSNYCEDGSGICECRPEYTPPKCDSCRDGYYGYPNCNRCECDARRSVSGRCDAKTGSCFCKPNFSGKFCDSCSPGYYNYPKCQPCHCNGKGALSESCDEVSGKCTCDTRFDGDKCDKCKNGHYNFPKCSRCSCDSRGTEPTICNKKTGMCLCRSNYQGRKCDQCLDGMHRYPECIPCQCFLQGSKSHKCDAMGNCLCHSNYTGKKCDQCNVGYYKYPDCLDCKCSSHGSVDIECNNYGKCQCKTNFDGNDCGKCKKGYFNFPNCEACNCDPKGVTDMNCDAASSTEICPCKKNVVGQKCNECQANHWKMQESNPDGCEECGCSKHGVLWDMTECDSNSGKCDCKYLVESRTCEECKYGTYNITEENILGCSDCGCNFGGSLDRNCNKTTGQCQCRPHIKGRTCSEPEDGYYFPTFHQYKFEAEDGLNSDNYSLKYRTNQKEFPGFSLNGYVPFMQFQDKIVIGVTIGMSSEYVMDLHYVNLEDVDKSMKITIASENGSPIGEQMFSASFKPSKTPVLARLSDPSTNASSLMPMDPGKWLITIQADAGLLLDYIVLIPSNYYEPSMATQAVHHPCIIEEYKKEDLKICRHYSYPKLSHFDMGLKKSDSTAANGKNHFRDYFDENQTSKSRTWPSFFQLPIPVSSSKEPDMKLKVSKMGKYVLIVVYFTPENINQALDLQLESSSSRGGSVNGKAKLYPCRYSSLCRQVIKDNHGKVKIFQFNETVNDLSLSLSGNKDAGIKSIVAIPEKEWSVGYIELESTCLKMNGECMHSHFQDVPHSQKVHFQEEKKYKNSKILPRGMENITANLAYLDAKEDRFTLSRYSPGKGTYVLIVHYYQPDYPGFDMDVTLQNGLSLKGKFHADHCPSHIGCRSIIQNSDGSVYFKLDGSAQVLFEKKSKSTVWLDSLVFIPREKFNKDTVEDEKIDISDLFRRHCVADGLHAPNMINEFCKDSVFAITALHNNGTLPCQCDPNGSLSNKCAKFGGQCKCKIDTIGRKCDMCMTGYYGFPDCKPCNCPQGLICQPTNGSCVCPPRVTGEKCDQCSEFSYGHDPVLGCKECKCNILGVKDDDLHCDSLTGACKCKENIEGRKCDHCLVGFSSFPTCSRCNCYFEGTNESICDQSTGKCICKKNVTGPTCDVCTEGTFNLDGRNPNGCTECFCFERSKNCSSSSFFRSKVNNMKNWHLADMILRRDYIYGDDVFLKLMPEDKINAAGNSIQFNSSSDGKIVYFGAPSSYLGNKLVSYGGVLKYNISYQLAKSSSGPAVHVPAADIILNGADTHLFHYSKTQPTSPSSHQVSIEVVETNFKLLNKSNPTRGVLMEVLNDLKGLYIRATYLKHSHHSILDEVVLETADESFNPDAEEALSVEQCACPPNYQGLSCEECTPGFYFSGIGKYGGECIPCQCNGHTDMCDPHTGICESCKDNTFGDNCEKCQKGYYGNATRGTPNDCKRCACPLPSSSNNFADECEVMSDGLGIKCSCFTGYSGTRCETCATGYFGKPDVPGEVCKPCECFGNVNLEEYGACDPMTGVCLRCLNNTHGDDCSKCAPGYFGDAIHLKNCHRCPCDNCGTTSCDGRSGACKCKDNVIGDNCNECKPNHWNFSSCQGCKPCHCHPASESTQCDVWTGQCKCHGGVIGLLCDKCAPGYWNYTSEGCTRCKCNEEFSRGGTCNAKTGTCECMMNVIGENCDSCPERQMLVKNEGCRECDQCIHTLLDVYENVSGYLAPVWEDFNEAAEGLHTHQKLIYLNETFLELLPRVKALVPSHYDLNPLEEQVKNMKERSRKFQKLTAITAERSVKTETDGRDVHSEAIRAESLVNDTMAYANNIVTEIESLTFNIIGAGSKMEAALLEAQNLLQNISETNFNTSREKAIGILEKINDVFNFVYNITNPIKNQTHMLEFISDELNSMNHKFIDSKNHTQRALDHVNEAKALNENLRISKLEHEVEIATNLSKVVNNALEEANLYVQNASKILNMFESDHENLKINKDKLMRLISLIREATESNDQDMKDLKDLVRNASNHVEFLHEKANELSNLFSNIRNTSEQAVEAANAYKKIVNTIDNAIEAARSATQLADEAFSMSEGLWEKNAASGQRSSELLRDAKDALNITQTSLMPELKIVKTNVAEVTDMNKNINEKHAKLNRDLDNIPPDMTDLLLNNASKATVEANTLSDDVLLKISDIPERTPASLKVAKGLLGSINQAKANISLAHGEAKKIQKQIPKVKKTMMEHEERQKEVNNTLKEIKNLINRIEQQIKDARKEIEKIKNGVRLFENSTLVLRNPRDLSIIGTSGRVSMYFRTSRNRGLLLYIGNEMGTSSKSKNVTTDDFMALQIENSNPTLTIDLGSSPSMVMVRKNVSDGQWYQIIVERSGKAVALSICESIMKNKDDEKKVCQTNEAVLSGTSSILNLDENLSKIVVGGYPSHFTIQNQVIENTFFEGEIEELVIGDNPVSLWNFVEAADVYGARQRDKLVPFKPETGLKFYGKGYAILDYTTISMKSKSAIQLKFKTTASDGLLFLVEKLGSFLSIELADGKVLYQFDLGSGITTLRSMRKYNDNSWHSVQAARDGNNARLKVDDEPVEVAGTSKGQKYLSVSDNVYIGGYPTKHNLASVTQTKFDGCIDEVFIETPFGSSPIDLNGYSKAAEISPGCPMQVRNVVSFSGNEEGFIKWANIEAETSFQLNFRFRTTQLNSLLFYATDYSQRNTISMCLADGVLLMYGPQGRIRVSSANKRRPLILNAKKYNDGEWHTVTATYNTTGMQVDIDDTETFKSKKKGEWLTIHIRYGSLYFGGVPNGYNISAIAVHNQNAFSGCMGDATLNGNSIKFYAVSAPDMSYVFLGRCVGSDYEHFSGPSTQLGGVQPLRPKVDPLHQKESCALPMNPKSEPNLAYNNGYRFGTNPTTYLEFHGIPHQTKQMHDFTMEFKTDDMNGIMFYLAEDTHKHYIALYMLKGKLLFKYNCGLQSKTITISGTWNDGKWHKVVLKRDSSRGEISVDDEVEEQESKCNLKWMDSVSSYFIGGISPTIKEKVKDNLQMDAGFSGCVRKYHIAGHGSLNPDIAEKVIPCSDNVEKGVFFSADGGYIKIDDKYKVGISMAINMEIKPRSSSGILLSVHGDDDYLVLQMYKGKIIFSVDNGRGNITAEYNPSDQSFLCNGKWHKITALKNKNTVYLSVDDIVIDTAPGSTQEIITNTKNILYLGGHANLGVKMVGLRPRRQFVGCIRNLVINSIPIDLSTKTAVGNVTVGACPTI